MVDADNDTVRWRAVSTLRDDEVDFDEDWLNEAIDQMLSAEDKKHKISLADNSLSNHNDLPEIEEPQASVPSEENELVFEEEKMALQVENSSRSAVFDGQVLENASFVGQTLESQSFRGASLINADFSGVSLKNIDFSGADLSGADFSNANLEGVDLSGAILRGTKFAHSRLDNVKFNGADLDQADLSDINPNDLSLEDLQALIEYLAKYFPHKLNFALLNLRLLDLTRIDLSKCDLRGADFTGIDFTGVSLIGVNLSECVITPQQIAQALGHPPTQQELMQLFPPRDKERSKSSGGIDWSDFFFNDREIGVWDVSKDRGLSIESLIKTGRKVFRHRTDKPQLKEHDSQEPNDSEGKSQAEIDKEKVLENIEKNRQAVLEARKERQQALAKEEHHKNLDIDLTLVRGRGSMER